MLRLNQKLAVPLLAFSVGFARADEVSRLISKLSDDDAANHAAAADGLKKLGGSGKKANVALQRRILNDPSPFVRLTAAQALAAVDPANSLETIVAVIRKKGGGDKKEYKTLLIKTLDEMQKLDFIAALSEAVETNAGKNDEIANRLEAALIKAIEEIRKGSASGKIRDVASIAEGSSSENVRKAAGEAIKKAGFNADE